MPGKRIKVMIATTMFLSMLMEIVYVPDYRDNLTTRRAKRPEVPVLPTVTYYCSK